MKKTFFYKAGLQKLCLLATMFTTPYVVCAQANYWSVFGDPSVTSLSGCNNSNRMSGNVAPTSVVFTGISDIADAAGSYSFGNTWAAVHLNSIYNKSGQLLFSVNSDGIYAADGYQTKTFGDHVFTALSCLTGYEYETNTAAAFSEIVAFPVPGLCNNYYVVFWCTATDGTVTGNVLRCVQVQIDPATYSPTADAYLTVLSDQLLTPPTCVTGGTQRNFVYGIGSVPTSSEIVADAANSDGSRDVYTVELEDPGTAMSVYPVTIRKWTFNSPFLGGVPTTSTVIASSTSLLYPVANKAKIFKVDNGSGGTNKMLAYLGYNNLDGTSPNYMQTYNLTTTGDYYNYKAPTAIASKQGISGFEYLPSPKNVYCFTYHSHNNTTGITTGGFGYASPGTGSGTTNITALASNYYLVSDLELTKHNDMLLVYNDPTTYNNELAYLPESTLNSTFTSSTPTVFSTSCSGTSNPISVLNYSQRFIGDLDDINVYLGNQIRGEDYSTWGPDVVGTYSVTGSESWTPTFNPVATASGVSTSTISMSGIVIPAGQSLTISNMTIKMEPNTYIDVMAGSSGVTGGRLVLDHSIITVDGSSCSGSSIVWGGVRVYGDPLHPQVLTSGNPQGYVKMTSSVISYANIGVLIGTETGIAALSPFVGGGILQATNSKFYNDGVGVLFLPYSNIGSSGFEANNLSNFNIDSFYTDNVATISSGTYYGIYGIQVKGIAINGCNFENFNGNYYPSYGIYGYNAGFRVSTWGAGTPGALASVFSSFGCGIFQFSNQTKYTVNINGCLFEYNHIGIHLSSTPYPVVVGNTFNVPEMTAAVAIHSPFYGPVATAPPIQTIGLYLDAATKYTVNSNKFWYSSPYVYIYTPPFTAPLLPHNQSVGVLASKTGGDENLVNNNTYNSLGIANLSNYRNYNDHEGLWFKCNTHINNLRDIDAEGTNSNPDHGDGIRFLQGLSAGNSYLGVTYPLGLPGGNTFSVGADKNLYSDPGGTYIFNYVYSTVGSSAEIPVTYNTSTTGLSTIKNCIITNIYGPTSADGLAVNPTTGADAVDGYSIINSNVNYYLTDSSGVTHRDSLYYWVSQVSDVASDMARTGLLLEDSLIDSAYSIYNTITNAHSVDSVDSVEYKVWGNELMTIRIFAMLRAGIPSSTFSAYTATVDSMTDSTFKAGVETVLIDVFQNAHSWARNEAENMLVAFDKKLADSIITAMPDTILYPTMPDSIYHAPSPKGVLAVTEISEGPSYGCQYAEVIVANCGSDASNYVDVRGWVINDNSGIFNAADSGCAQNAGITAGHFRLKYDSLWAHIPIGSILVLYNDATNCYRLSDTFKIDTAHNIFYIPVGNSLVNNHLEQYSGAENNSVCSYCSDSGTTVYSAATDWMGKVGLDSVTDGFQVLCPGCAPVYSTSPSFYHGIGYKLAPAITGTIGSVATMADNTGAGYKYVFIGNNATDLVTPSAWSIAPADAGGSIPSTLGYVDSVFYANVVTHALGLPCCSSKEQGGGDQGGQQQGGKPAPAPKAIAGINVYPNPANTTLYFEFPMADETMIKLMDVTGRVMAEQTLHGTSNAAFNVKGYAAGVYMYQVITNGQSQTGKVLIGE